MEKSSRDKTTSCVSWMRVAEVGHLSTQADHEMSFIKFTLGTEKLIVWISQRNYMAIKWKDSTAIFEIRYTISWFMINVFTKFLIMLKELFTTEQQFCHIT